MEEVNVLSIANRQPYLLHSFAISDISKTCSLGLLGVSMRRNEIFPFYRFSSICFKWLSFLIVIDLSRSGMMCNMMCLVPGQKSSGTKMVECFG